MQRVARPGALLLKPELLVLAASVSFYAAFVERTRVVVAGRSYFVLADDAMISMRYARNLVDGHGLVFNAGQHVEGYSNFLWTLWMGAVHLLPFGDATASLPVAVSGAAILVGIMFLVRATCRRLLPAGPGADAAALSAMFAVGLFFPLVAWTLRGMEAGLGALLVMGALWLVLPLSHPRTLRREIVVAAVLSLAVLTRDDLVVEALPIVALMVWSAPPERRRTTLAFVGGAIVLAIAGHALFRLAYYGDPLPNTYYLKLAHIPLAARIHRGITGVAYTSIRGLCVPIAVAIVGLAASYRMPRFADLSLLAAVFVASCAYSVYVGGDFAEELRYANRFIVIGVPPLVTLAAVGAYELATAELTRRVRWASAAGALLLVLAAVAQSRSWPDSSPLNFPSGGLDGRRAGTTIAVIGAAALVAFLIPRARLPASRWSKPVVIAAFCLLVLAGADQAPVRSWLNGNGRDALTGDIAQGVAIRRYTAPSATVALVRSGAAAYLSHRKVVDLLGKVDPVIARGRPRGGFRPGHDKWNYAHSIGRLRPDFVLSLWILEMTPQAQCQMVRWGYVELGVNSWVRRESRNVDVVPLGGALGGKPGAPATRTPPGCRTAPT